MVKERLLPGIVMVPSGTLKSFDNFLCAQLEKLSDIQHQPESQLKFIIEAWLQVNYNAVVQMSQDLSGISPLTPCVVIADC